MLVSRILTASLRSGLGLGVVLLGLSPHLAQAQTSQTPQAPQAVECEILIAGGGLGGVAAALEALSLGRQVCMTEITDWLGGQVSTQGVSALDERPLQRQQNLFPARYAEFRRRVQATYGQSNPGRCWVSALCFSPTVGQQVVREMLKPYERSGQLRLFTDTVVKDLDRSDNQLTAVTAIRHQPRQPAQNSEAYGRPLSAYLLDWYNPAPSPLFDKTVIRFVPPAQRSGSRLPWVVIDATETGELLPLARVPYRVGSDPPNRWEPSASRAVEAYCTQGFTYPFVMERTATPQVPIKPEFYESPLHKPYYSYEKPEFNFARIFTYRRIRGQQAGQTEAAIRVGDQTLQNWTWGNDWRISIPTQNLVLTDAQLRESRQLEPGGWQGGLRVEALRQAEDHALGFFYWLVAGQTDSQVPGARTGEYHFRYRLMRGTDSPLGTEHGLSRYPYIREGRRIVGRVSGSYPQGFTIYETDISQKPSDLNRGRPYLFYDAVGVSQYPIDFHGCIDEQFAALPGNTSVAQAPSYPFQIPLRALIPQEVENLLAGNKNIATSHISNAAYRVHPVEWAVGAAAGNTAAFALSNNLFPGELTLPTAQARAQLSQLQTQIRQQGNLTLFPGATIFETQWANYR
ncbi:FAD-dependent oxidoreductase [Leptolyngbya sp. FACHB-261]|uniref:FAD-dependent oxidoreductase n=1 Tax=Leptolyngbya sp. FACHB-261 TaxID=2692806 RepID=UPI001689C121|nr:FAD-dependent oxidoreductase [Leptolyngbya sp. FACHB-261]MBD2103291.1 FAD-dependent oxidoreductase [Leptolyngbya sp. FACHB-261]